MKMTLQIEQKIVFGCYRRTLSVTLYGVVISTWRCHSALVILSSDGMVISLCHLQIHHVIIPLFKYLSITRVAIKIPES